MSMNQMDSLLKSALNRLDEEANCFNYRWLETPIGQMLAIGDNEALYVLEFGDYPGLEREVRRLLRTTQKICLEGDSKAINSIERELELYFKRELRDFKTPTRLIGTPFRIRVWEQLKKIPFGKTKSYRQISEELGFPKAFRAVAQANGANQLAIIIPCHRVINANGALGGYAGGLERKEWLLNHEKST